MAKKPTRTKIDSVTRKAAAQTTLKVTLGKQDFPGQLAAYVFDTAGNLLEQTPVKAGAIKLSLAQEVVQRSRLFIAPVEEQAVKKQPTLKAMSRVGAYSPSLRSKGTLIDTVHIPDNLVVDWLLCLCTVNGRVIKKDNGNPICGARVHICEVDKLWRWILELPELEVFRLRDELLRVIENPIPIPRPQPDPLPIEFIGPFTAADNIAALGPQPEPPDLPTSALRSKSLPYEFNINLRSSSVVIVRKTLVDNLQLIYPYLCLWPYWWTFHSDEIAVVESDGSGRFEYLISYVCSGDKPDLYFWVEYEIDGIMETVYHPPIPCNTYWNYACGSLVTLEIDDARVPACDTEPDPAGCKVQVLSVGRKVSVSEIHGPGATTANEGLTTFSQPFGGKLEPRVWFSRSDLIAKGIEYYRWSYRRLTESDGTPLTSPGSWMPLTRTVVRHYAKKTGNKTTHEPFILGPYAVGSESNLFKIKPATLPPGAVEWTVVDEREDLASAHFESHKLGSGANDCIKALNAAGKYELKLELFRNNGTLVTDWAANGIDLEVTDQPAPFGTNTVAPVTASDYHRINPTGGTDAFRMVLRVDNNCCSAAIDALSGVGLSNTPCGFYEITPSATVNLGFTAYHPNDFATFTFSVVQGVTNPVSLASVSGKAGNSPVPTLDSPPSHAYTLSGSDHYIEMFLATELLNGCTRAAFSGALHVWTQSQDGYGRLTSLDRFTHSGFALTPP